MGSHSVTCHPAEVTFQPLAQPKLVLDLATPEGCKAELTLLTGYTPWWYTRPKTGTHPSTSRAQCTVTSFMRRTTLATTPSRQPYWQRYCTALEQWASVTVCGVVQGMELRNFCRGSHLYSPGRRSRWASAHILVFTFIVTFTFPTRRTARGITKVTASCCVYWQFF